MAEERGWAGVGCWRRGLFLVWVIRLSFALFVQLHDLCLLVSFSLSFSSLCYLSNWPFNTSHFKCLQVVKGVVCIRDYKHTHTHTHTHTHIPPQPASLSCMTCVFLHRELELSSNITNIKRGWSMHWLSKYVSLFLFARHFGSAHMNYAFKSTQEFRVFIKKKFTHIIRQLFCWKLLKHLFRSSAHQRDSVVWVWRFYHVNTVNQSINPSITWKHGWLLTVSGRLSGVYECLLTPVTLSGRLRCGEGGGSCVGWW